MKVLVTGANGFVGSHFVEYALGKGADVTAAIRLRSNVENLQGVLGNTRLRLAHCELTDPVSVQDLINEESGYRYIIHLAAQSFVRASWDQPHHTLTNNVIGQMNVLEAVLGTAMAGTDTRVLVIGSSEEYGFIAEEELPVSESQPLRPLSPYAVSKVAQDLMGYQYFKSYGLQIIRSRAFNHEGPRRGEHFVTSNFARQVLRARKAIEAGEKHPPIFVGDLMARRDYTDVRDIVRGYWDLLLRGTPGEVYNLCSGEDWEIADVLDTLLTEAGLTDDQVDIRLDMNRLRPSDVPVLRGSHDKITAELGWAPTIKFEQTLKDILSYWEEKTK